MTAAILFILAAAGFLVAGDRRKWTFKDRVFFLLGMIGAIALISYALTNPKREQTHDDRRTQIIQRSVGGSGR